jgi:asparagine synthetase B (glutamine-hydrolysing)
MHSESKRRFGEFTVFGFTQQPQTFLQQKVPARLGITPRTIDFGAAGHFFFYTSYGDVAETDDRLVLKLGLLHSRQGSSLSARQLIEHNLASPRLIEGSELRGNALVACFSKQAPEFSVYKTLLSMPQLYYSTHEQALLCTDGPRPHLALLDRAEASQEAMVQHFLFRYALGTHTYFRDIHRLLSGHLFCWRAGGIDIQQVRDLRAEPDTPRFDEANSQAIRALYEGIDKVMGAYIQDIRATGLGFGNMLSGGVDSTLLQVLINDHVPEPSQRKTFSYALRVPRFEFEIEYAREASQALETDHTLVPIQPDDYPGLLIRNIETLGYPIPAESQPCKLAIAEHLSRTGSNLHYFFVGTGGDTLHGTTLARKMAILETARHVPLSGPALKGIAALAAPLSPSKAHGLRQIAGMLPELNDPYSYRAPANITAVYTDLEIARRAFGDDALKQALAYRHEMERIYLNSSHHIEKVHALELVTDAYETGVLVNHLYLAHGREQIYPFLDEETIRISYAFDPKIRYLKGREVKPLLKRILEQRGLAGIAHRRKGPSVFNDDLYAWMRNGSLREMVEAMERPAFLSQADFEKLLAVPDWNPLDEPNWFLWNLLTFDLFQKRVLRAGALQA